MAFIFGTDPADADRRILACVKHNLRDKPPALAFETDAEEIGLVGEVPNLVCQGECEFDPKRLLGDVDPGKQGRKPDKRAAANQWLAEYLIGKNNKAKGGMVLEDAKQHGHSKNTVRRAADELGVVKSGKGGPNVTWSLPQEFMDAYNAGQAS
jgi:hypothetical protein